MEKQQIKMVVIGGSWGGIQASLAILKDLPENYPLPIILVLHRLKNFESDLQGIYSRKIALKAVEIDEKETIEAGSVYLAPPNYHVLIENDCTFSLDVSEYENYSRPSIDVTFSSAARVYGPGVAGILLSGASKDGSLGLLDINKRGGVAIAQDPLEAEVATMPSSAIQLIPECKVLNTGQIKDYLLTLL